MPVVNINMNSYRMYVWKGMILLFMYMLTFFKSLELLIAHNKKQYNEYL